MLNKERDLFADLKICEEATSGPWVVDKYNSTQVRQPNYSKRRRIQCPCDLHGIIDARFIAEAREGWPYAIRRLLEAEARIKELEAEVERLKEQLKRMA